MISNSKVLPVFVLAILLSIIILVCICSCSPPQHIFINSLGQSADLIKERKANEALALLKHTLGRAEIFPEKIRFKYNDTEEFFKTLLNSLSLSQIPISDKIEIYEIIYKIAQVLRFEFDPNLKLGIMASVNDFRKNQKTFKLINQYLANNIYSLIEAENFINALDLITIYKQRSIDDTPIPGGDLERLELLEGVLLAINKGNEVNKEKIQYNRLLRDFDALYKDTTSEIFNPIESDVKSCILRIVDAFTNGELPSEIRHAFYSYNISLADRLVDNQFLINLLEIYMIPNLNINSFYDLIEESTSNYSDKISLRGKVLPIDILGKYASIHARVYYSLPKNTRAIFPEEVMTIVFIKTSTIKVGEYIEEKSKQKTGNAEIERWDVTIVDRHKRSVLQHRIFTGSSDALPRSTYSIPDPIKPDKKVIAYINSLLANP